MLLDFFFFVSVELPYENDPWEFRLKTAHTNNTFYLPTCSQCGVYIFRFFFTLPYGQTNYLTPFALFLFYFFVDTIILVILSCRYLVYS